MVLETGSRIGQDTIFFPDFQREKLERALMQATPGDYEAIAHRGLRRFGYLGRDETVELIPSLRTGKTYRLVHLLDGVFKGARGSLDVFLPKSVIPRPAQFVKQTLPSGKVLYYHDVPALYHAFSGRFGIYSGENLKKEEILHDTGEEPWQFANISGRWPHEIRVWDRPACVLTAFPDTKRFLSKQLNLPI